MKILHVDLNGALMDTSNPTGTCKKVCQGRQSALSSENGANSHKMLKPPIVRKGKLVVVDLAGSERIDKSGV